MQINRATEYGVHVMCELARRPRGHRARLEALAQATDVPAPFLSKILQRLVATGLLASWRGADGGFELTKPATSITLFDVVTALEGPLALNICLTSPSGCGQQPYCRVHLVWTEAQAAMGAVLASVTLDELARPTTPRPTQPEESPKRSRALKQ